MSQDPIPEFFRQRIQTAKEQQLEVLDLSSYCHHFGRQTQLSRIPDKVFELTHLKILNLSGNRLTNVPIGGLSSLKWLDLSHNQLTKIPDSISTQKNGSIRE